MTDRHRRTLEVYEHQATAWQDRRSASAAQPQAFAEWVAGHDDLPEGATVDLGCGPGWHLRTLADGAIGLDGAAAMLHLAAARAPDAPLVQADLCHLPLRRHCVRAAWASRSYVHLHRAAVPLALWDLHRSLVPGGLAEVSFFAGDREHGSFDHDDFPGRSFSSWPPDLLGDVLVGAGFEVLEWQGPTAQESATTSDGDLIRVRLQSLRTLADTVGPGMRLLLVGLNPSPHAADSGVGFSGPNNRGWPALQRCGLATVDRDPLGLLTGDRIGMTDLVKRATARAGELSPAEYRGGLDRLEALCGWLQPAAVCVVGITGWRHAISGRAEVGEQDRRLGGRPVWVMPNPSGLNAHTTTAELAEHLAAAAALADRQ